MSDSSEMPNTLNIMQEFIMPCHTSVFQIYPVRNMGSHRWRSSKWQLHDMLSLFYIARWYLIGNVIYPVQNQITE